MSSSSARITSYFSLLPVKQGENDSDMEVLSPSPCPCSSLPPPQMLYKEASGDEHKTTPILTKRKGPESHETNELQPPRKLQHVKTTANLDDNKQDKETDPECHTPSNASKDGSNMDMNLDDQANTHIGHRFTFTPPFTQSGNSDNNARQAKSPSLFSEIDDSDPEEYQTDQKTSPLTNLNKTPVTRNLSPHQKTPTSTAILSPPPNSPPPPHKGFPPIHGVTAKSLTDAITTNTKKVWSTINVTSMLL
ncbi:hypothetical protein EST38_g13355 [Candolleomyces aberdarensis]|uniref:Uncharacterized protein n=1 Tax=Candolleomyces aberdarensis TaxID=2316362 RepID=A0A4Q2D0V5_9AGAR|nr:hypothetical protein EST38_g13355 [Candolleomyces aberdarensis]